MSTLGWQIDSYVSRTGSICISALDLGNEGHSLTPILNQQLNTTIAPVFTQ
jgi:hypothetical protein